jgi:hydrogenase maturation protease
MKPVLLLGVGNTLRQDDGAGAAVAWRFQDHPLVESLPVIQLLPEHIEGFHGRKVVLFVDAAVNCEHVTCEVISPGTHRPRRSPGHLQHPADLVCLYQWLYGAWPLSQVVSIPAVQMGFGEQLSDSCRQAIDEAVRLIESLVSARVKV